MIDWYRSIGGIGLWAITVLPVILKGHLHLVRITWGTFVDDIFFVWNAVDVVHVLLRMSENLAWVVLSFSNEHRLFFF